MNQKTSYHHTIETIFTFAVMLSLFRLAIAKADDILLPEKPATNCEKEALPLGNGRLGDQGTFSEDFFSGGLNRCKCLSNKHLSPPVYTKGKRTASGPLGGDRSLDKSGEKALI